MCSEKMQTWTAPAGYPAAKKYLISRSIYIYIYITLYILVILVLGVPLGNWSPHVHRLASALGSKF